MRVRVGTERDAERVRAIQKLSPEAAQWDPAGYDWLVAEIGGEVVGVLVTRSIALGESALGEREILNLAVAPAFRRRGVARALLAQLSATLIFLEVRAGNQAARALYGGAGFVEAGRRAGYYREPDEDAIVMRWQS